MQQGHELCDPSVDRDSLEIIVTESAVPEAAAALAEGEARGVAAPVRREPPSSHRAYPQTTASAHRMHALLVDDGPHGRRRPAIRPAAHAHER